MLIKPVIDIIASGSQIWNFAITDSNNLFGIIHLKCCKFTLGVCNDVTNLAAYGELEHTPLSVCRKFSKVQVVKHWHAEII